ncbi:MAG TPA: MoaD/ThiS family protein [Nitrososphaeraceae archaeon]|jgi:molybdopterin converting factor subunit 1|nr:MoaD/ThiS family protein [Nitrososphaeraceae archaeon]
MSSTEKGQYSEECGYPILVDVRLFAWCRELIGKDKITLKLKKNQTTAGGLRKKILDLYPRLSSHIQFVIAINCEIVDDITPIRSKDAVAILPPVSGG